MAIINTRISPVTPAEPFLEARCAESEQKSDHTILTQKLKISKVNPFQKYLFENCIDRKIQNFIAKKLPAIP